MKKQAEMIYDISMTLENKYDMRNLGPALFRLEKRDCEQKNGST
jgi:hypothetical protein